MKCFFLNFGIGKDPNYVSKSMTKVKYLCLPKKSKKKNLGHKTLVT